MRRLELGKLVLQRSGLMPASGPRQGLHRVDDGRSHRAFGSFGGLAADALHLDKEIAHGTLEGGKHWLIGRMLEALRQERNLLFNRVEIAAWAFGLVELLRQATQHILD